MTKWSKQIEYIYLLRFEHKDQHQSLEADNFADIIRQQQQIIQNDYSVSNRKSIKLCKVK